MGTNYQRKIGKVRIYRYRCRTYREKGEKECTSKSISEKDLEKIVYQAVMAFIRQVECLNDMVSRFHSEFFQKMQRSIEKEKSVAERAIRQGKNEKIRLYKEYSRQEHNAKHSAKHSSIEQACKDGNPDSNKEWYLKEKQKRDREIRYHEERKAQLEKKTAFFERLEKEQAGWIKEILSYKDITSDEEGLTAQMASIFVDKIFLYDGKRVEVVLNLKDEYQTLCQLIDESLYSHMEQVCGTEEGRG